MVMTVMMMVLLKIVAEVIVQKAGLRKRRAGAVKTIKRVAVPMTVTWQLPKAVDSMVYFLQVFVVNSLAFSEFHGKKHRGDYMQDQMDDHWSYAKRAYCCIKEKKGCAGGKVCWGETCGIPRILRAPRFFGFAFATPFGTRLRFRCAF